MKLTAFILAIATLVILKSCVKDPEIVCFVDPRSPALGNYNMVDSVFFLGELFDAAPDDDNEDLGVYDMTVVLDSLGGDTILLKNMLNFSDDFRIDLKAVYTNGNISIPAQPLGEAYISGSGTFSGNVLNYTASVDDGGYSFKGIGN